MPADRAAAAIAALGTVVIAFDAELARIAGELRPFTRHAGLSLGDRCCLAVAKSRGLPVITTERAWGQVAAACGVVVVNLREPD